MRAGEWMERSRRERPSLAVPRLPGPGPAPPPGGVTAGTGNRDRNGWRQAGSDRSRGDRRDRRGCGRGGSAPGRPRSEPGFAFGKEIAGRVRRHTGRYRRGDRVRGSVSPMRRSGSASRRSGCRGGPGIAESRRSPVSGHRGRDPELAAAGRGSGHASGDAEPRARGYGHPPLRALFSGHTTGRNWRLHDRSKPRPKLGRSSLEGVIRGVRGDNWAAESTAPPLQTVVVAAAAGPGRQ